MDDSVRARHATPVVLSTLNQALLPFRGSYHCTRIVIGVFSNLIDDLCSLEAPTDAELQEKWQDELTGMREEPERDPESLQVVQILSRFDCREVWNELKTHLHNLNGDWHETYLSKPGSYWCVRRVNAWLVGCAELHETGAQSSKDELFLRHLDHIARPQPRYERADVVRESEREKPNPQITGPWGALMAAIRSAFQVSNTYALRALVRFLFRDATKVADIWTYTDTQGIRESDELPPYEWYAIGLQLSRADFIDTIQDFAEAEEDMLPHQLRDILKIVSFVDSWDRLWAEAKDFCARTYNPSTRLHYYMLSWISDHVRAKCIRIT